MDNIKSNADSTSEASKRHHFELAANYLQPSRPVLTKFPSGTKRDAIKISDVIGSGFGTKQSAEKSKSTQSKKANGHGQGRGGKGKSPCSKQENYKQDRAIAASVYKNMKSISKKKGGVGE
eukprot:11048512-Ditylum_brightwellii.AAC.1